MGRYRRHGYLVGFFISAYAFTCACWMGSGRVESERARWLLLTLGQYGPFLAGVVFTAWEEGRSGLRDFFARLVRWRFHPLWALVALALPPLMYYAAIATKAIFVEPAPPLKPYRILHDVVINFFIVVLVGGPLGEEPGWRGYALPRLRTLWGTTPAAIVLGVLWAWWHLPRYWLAQQFPLGAIAGFTAACAGLTIIFAFLYERTGGSVLVCLLLHGSLNTFWVLLPMDWAATSCTLIICIVAAGVTWYGRHGGTVPLLTAPADPSLASRP